MHGLLQTHLLLLVGVRIINCKPYIDTSVRNEVVTPDPCLNVTCYHGNCTSTVTMVYGALHLVGQCVCAPGWSGTQCQVYDEEMNSVAPAVTVTREPTSCLGLPVVDVDPTPCYGLPCFHGRCMDLSSNGVKAFVCQCDEGWFGIDCSDCCDLVCNYGACQVNSETGERYCVCDNSSLTESSNCIETVSSSLREDSPSHWMWVEVGAGVGILVVFASVIFLLLYWTWRRRHLLIMRIVYFFEKYDDSERRFHVFISYRSSTDDEKFVMEKLHPKLEDMKLKVCVHYKDFIPGTSIAENILNAVENSSRTILVLSPDFCSGAWPRFEVQAAQREMLRMRHRIVPVLFRDISDIQASGRMDVLLQHIIDSVTYLKWPSDGDKKAEDRFWKLLKLSMPKLRDDR